MASRFLVLFSALVALLALAVARQTSYTCRSPVEFLVGGLYTSSDFGTPSSITGQWVDGYLGGKIAGCYPSNGREMYFKCNIAWMIPSDPSYTQYTTLRVFNKTSQQAAGTFNGILERDDFMGGGLFPVVCLPGTQ